MPSNRIAPVLRLAHLSGLCAIALLTVGWHAPAEAQSRFIASTLKPPFLGKVEANQLIDSQNRVFAYLSHYRSIGLEFGFGGSKTRWVTRYDEYPSTWPASTSSSLSPTKLLQDKYLRITGISRDGSKLLANRMFTSAAGPTFFAPVIHDTATRQALSYVIDGSASTHLGPNAIAASVNDQGWVAGVVSNGRDALGNPQTMAARWRPGHAVDILPIPQGMNGSSATSINSSGDIVGWVEQRSADDYYVRRAAKWRVDGTLQLLDTSSERGTGAISIADNGTTLIEGSTTSSDGRHRSSLALHSVDGQVQTLPITDDQSFTRPGFDHHSLSPDGDTVVGTKYVVDAPYGRARERAFIYKDGVMHDLTEYASARGLKLPSGAHLWTAISVNAQGSIATGYDTSDGRFVALKLTALP